MHLFESERRRSRYYERFLACLGDTVSLGERPKQRHRVLGNASKKQPLGIPTKSRGWLIYCDTRLVNAIFLRFRVPSSISLRSRFPLACVFTRVDPSPMHSRHGTPSISKDINTLIGIGRASFSPANGHGPGDDGNSD